MRAYRFIAVAGIVASACIRREISTVEVASDMMSPDLRAATNLPDQFTIAGGAAASGDCPELLTDAGLHTTLELQRSFMVPSADSAGAVYKAVGDYSVTPSGRYGEADGEGLRVDCSRLSALGVVRL